MSALLVSVLFVQIGSGSLGPLDALSGLELGFSPVQIGWLGSAHFVGFFLGCIAGPGIVIRVGHARAFAVMAAISTIAILMHPVYEDPYFWMFLRLWSGFTVAGGYTVIESWLQSKLSNDNRGTVFSAYRMVDMVGMLCSQIIIAGLAPAHYISYNIIAMVACLALLPLALTQARAPTVPERRKFRPLFVYALSPLAAFGVIVAGLTTSSFRMVAPIYAVEQGLTQAGVALFLALAVIGGLMAQLPAGIMADRISRRSTLFLFSILASIACLAIASQPIDALAGIPFVYLAAFLFGFATLPIYSVCAAHASDFAKREDMLDMSASLIFFFAIGAVSAPSFTGWLIENYGPPAMFSFILAAHLALIVYSGWRYVSRPAVASSKPYRYTPRTSLFIANRMKRRDGETGGEDQT